jgi:hypothetical protein
MYASIALISESALDKIKRNSRMKAMDEAFVALSVFQALWLLAARRECHRWPCCLHLRARCVDPASACMRRCALAAVLRGPDAVVRSAYKWFFFVIVLFSVVDVFSDQRYRRHRSCSNWGCVVASVIVVCRYHHTYSPAAYCAIGSSSVNALRLARSLRPLLVRRSADAFRSHTPVSLTSCGVCLCVLSFCGARAVCGVCVVCVCGAARPTLPRCQEDGVGDLPGAARDHRRDCHHGCLPLRVCHHGAQPDAELVC